MSDLTPAKPNVSRDDPMRSIVTDRRWFSRDQLIAGAVGVVLFHVIALMLLSQNLYHLEYEEPANPYRDFSIELTDSFVEEEEPPPTYTQTNPDVAENEPDDTNRFAARDQQAANPDEVEELDAEALPAVESDDNIDTDQFLTGSLAPPELAPPPTQQEQGERKQEEQVAGIQQPLLQAVNPSQSALKKEIPVMGSQEDADPDESGIAEYDYDRLDEAPTNVTDLIKGEAEEGEEEAELSPELMASSGMPVQPMERMEDGVPSPKARPRLPRVPSSPVRNSKAGVASVGQLAVDAKASQFGEYMERLIETVKINWDDLVVKSSYVERNSVVRIRFILTKEGVVSDMEILEGTNAKAAGIYMCRQAIERGVPFGPWPAGLVELFGDDEDVTFNFHYY